LQRDGLKLKGFARAGNVRPSLAAELFEINDLGAPSGSYEKSDSHLFAIWLGLVWFDRKSPRPFAVVEWSVW